VGVGEEGAAAIGAPALLLGQGRADAGDGGVAVRAPTAVRGQRLRRPL